MKVFSIKIQQKSGFTKILPDYRIGRWYQNKVREIIIIGGLDYGFTVLAKVSHWLVVQLVLVLH